MAGLPGQAALSESLSRLSATVRIRRRSRLGCARLRHDPGNVVRRFVLGVDAASYAAAPGTSRRHGCGGRFYLLRTAGTSYTATLALARLWKSCARCRRAGPDSLASSAAASSFSI